MAVTVQAAYDQWAASYDDDVNRTRDLDARVSRATFAGKALGRVLELGCGTGKNTRLFAEIATEVHGLDFSSAMLEKAQARGLGHHVRFTRADLTAPWPVEDATVDLVAAHLVLEHLPELGFVFAEAARVLVPGGGFHVSEFHPFRQYLGNKAVFEADGAAVDFPAFVHHVSEFLGAARAADLRFLDFGEHWHEADAGKPPRLLTLRFGKPPCC
ncbi:MAG: class I SAM-dependent methyltransferase [Thermoanaerobaculia bacterium]|nr:class I SAM-dependent methyltransferase [Thermoanaerobaculia bacterium]